MLSKSIIYIIRIIFGEYVGYFFPKIFKIPTHFFLRSQFRPDYGNQVADHSELLHPIIPLTNRILQVELLFSLGRTNSNS